MIKVWSDENRISVEFNGLGNDLIDEMGYLMKKFTNEVLKIDEVEFLETFVKAYQEVAKNEASNETNETHVH